MTYYTDALIGGLTWTGTTGLPASVGYSFGVSYEGGVLFTSARQTAALAAMQEWMNVANVTFHEVSAFSAVLTFSTAELGPDIAGSTSPWYYIGTTMFASAEVQIDDDVTTVAPGSYGFMALMHEIGHALGLKHPGDYNGVNGHTAGPFLPFAEDNRDATIMSYYAGAHATNINPPVTPMIYDIAAMQVLYGANHSYHAGNDTYNFNGSAVSKTIWDGGGIDTINASSFVGISQIDLREGLSNVTLIGQSNVWMAFGANIENAIGGSARDYINGNSLNNQLTGNGGDDNIVGDTGNDSIYGGAGNDTLYGNEGADVIYGGAAGGGTDGADVIYGGQGADALYGTAGNDKLYGQKGNDTLYGGLGNDTFYFASGGNTDTINHFDAPGAAVGDIISVAFHINGTSIATAADVLSHISYAGGEALLNLGAGDIVHIQGIIAGSLTAADFAIG